MTVAMGSDFSRSQRAGTGRRLLQYGCGRKKICTARLKGAARDFLRKVPCQRYVFGLAGIRTARFRLLPLQHAQSRSRNDTTSITLLALDFRWAWAAICRSTAGWTAAG